MDLICGKNQSFWDYDLTWSTSDPYFTFCFEETVLTLFPAFCLAIFFPFELAKLRATKRQFNFKKSKISKIFYCKIALNLILIILYGGELARVTFRRSNFEILPLMSQLLHTIAYVYTLAITTFNFLHLIPSCGTQFFFWTLEVIVNGVLFRTAFNKINEQNSNSNIDKIRYEIYMLRIIVFPIICLRFISELINDKTFIKTSESLWPNKRVNFIHKILYTWFFSTAWTGYKRPLALNDLEELNYEDNSVSQFSKVARYLAIHKNQATRVLFKVYGKRFCYAAFLKISAIILVVIKPELIRYLLNYIHSENRDVWKGIFISSLIAILSTTSSIIYVNSQEIVYNIAMRIKIALSSVVLRESMLVSSKNDSSFGQLLNLLSVDIEKVSEFMPVLNYSLCAPFQIWLGFYLLYRTLGSSAFAAIIYLGILVPIEILLIFFSKRFQSSQMKLKDQRIKLTSEVLTGIKVIKLYGWEKSFQNKIEKLREEELKYLKKISILNTISVYLCLSSPVLLALITFGTYILTNEENVFNAEKAFISLILFNIIKYPLDKIPETLSFYVQAAISIKRLNKFLSRTEIDAINFQSKDDSDSEIAVNFKNASFSWSNENFLKDITFSAKKGELIAIVGKIGSGKSSLISSLLRVLKLERGSFSINGTVSYVSQQAWIQNATVRENIIFLSPFEESKYNKIISSCSLETDILTFPSGDRTEIGENGINLSGGQKQRVALARGVYKNSSIYLLDDPLSAVDSQVAKYIFENVIGPNGLLKNSTRLLVTHNLNFLSQVDRIIVMKNGRISEIGTLFELIERKTSFTELLSEKKFSQNSLETQDLEIHDIKIEDEETILKFTSPIENFCKKGDGKLIKEEEIFKGSTRLKFYKNYFIAGGIGLILFGIIFAALSNCLVALRSIWLSEWSNEEEKSKNFSNRNPTPDSVNLKYLEGYTLLGCFEALSRLIFLVLFAFFSYKSSKLLHSCALVRILKCPMSYFDTTLTGRIINRFARDLNIIDTVIPQNTTDLINYAFETIFSVFVILQVGTRFFIMSLPIFIFFIWLQRFYVATSRQLKRLEAQSRSPIYSYFSEIISGSTIIRAFGKEKEFIKEFERRVETNQKCYFAFYISDMWISICLRVISALLVFLTCLFTVLFRDKISDGGAGLVITYSIHMMRVLSDLTKQISNLESNIVSVERVSELTETPQELDWESDKNDKPNDPWPNHGKVEFVNYFCKYRPGLDMVLKGVNLSINSKEKIGIVGRTGAGKSSMTLALFRLIEPSFGKILIDGIDITTIGLHDLRKRITIIPQDPVLFSGSIRYNLDPFDEQTDEKIWKCLEAAHLKNFFLRLRNSLNFKIDKGGDNLSTGQKQLVCLARALLRKTKILVLDEATASVDPETESLILKTIRKEFRDSTVITIAHRISNILNSDRVIVLENGKIKEFDSPGNLLAKTSSLFYQMSQDASLI